MKTLIAITAVMMLASCSSVKSTTDAALDQARTGASLGFSTQKVEKGYQVSGHASTNVFGIEPYGSFTAGVRYAPKALAPAPAPAAPKAVTK
jgi:hypothetical protein